MTNENKLSKYIIEFDIKDRDNIINYHSCECQIYAENYVHATELLKNLIIEITSIKRD